VSGDIWSYLPRLKLVISVKLKRNFLSLVKIRVGVMDYRVNVKSVRRSIAKSIKREKGNSKRNTAEHIKKIKESIQ
jgi:hypothetical protein